MSQTAPSSLYGFADAATAFDQRHPQWTAVMPRLGAIINLAFTQTQVMNTPIDKFVYFYGNLVAEDFMELFLMAVNGYGFAAMKLLRSMYEHTVTLKYLHEHPDELQAFFDFDRVQQYKLTKQIMDTFGEGALSQEIVATTEREYAEIKDKFMVKSCKSKTCSEQRVGHTWSKLDFVSMAKRAGAIGSVIVPNYFVPLRHAHSTFRTMTERLDMDDNQMSFRRESQPKEADQALMAAHNCLLVVLEVQKERFNISGLEELLQSSCRDWAMVWSPESLAPAQTEATDPHPSE
jgi:phosphoenolpyruvate synthase/pyruvate phosphate dikinase